MYGLTKKVVISFDYHNDRHYRYLLNAWTKNARFSVTFDDLTPSEVDTDNVGRVKSVITQRLNVATHLLVIVGQYANSYHSDRLLIGQRNWIWWEIEKAKELGKKIVVVKLASHYAVPDPLQYTYYSTANSFTESDVLRVIEMA